MGSKKEKKEGLESRKTELMVPKAEIAGLFRVLAEGLECGCLTYAGERVELDRLKGLKIGIKNQGENYGVKLKLKMAEAPKAEEPAGE